MAVAVNNEIRTDTHSNVRDNKIIVFRRLIAQVRFIITTKSAKSKRKRREKLDPSCGIPQGRL